MDQASVKDTGRRIPDPTELAAELQDTSTDDEDGIERPKRGAGLWGDGPPMQVEDGVPKDFVDGGGLCSPGRWAPRRRTLPDFAVVNDARDVLWSGFLRCVLNFDHRTNKIKLHEQ